MTTARERRAWQRLYSRAKSAMQRELDRPKLCDSNPAFPSRYNNLQDEVFVLSQKMDELGAPMAQTWPEIMQGVAE